MTLWEQLLFLLIAFAVSFSICGILIRSPNFLMDVPNYRSLHAEPVPRGGGMAFGLGFLVCLGGLLFLYYPESLNQAMAALFAGCILVYLLGLLDDALALPALFRLAGGQPQSLRELHGGGGPGSTGGAGGQGLYGREAMGPGGKGN